KESGVVTPLVIVACVALYFLWWIGFDNVLFAALHFPDGAHQQWQLWRLVSHAFLHFSLLHLVLNLVWWWQLAGNVEYLLGRLKLVQILVVSALFSGFAQFMLTDFAFGGLSGVVYALLGYSWICGKMQPLRGLAISQATALFMLFWLFIGFAQPLTVNIANGAHVAGLLAGLGLGFLDCLQMGRRDLKK
ncbi:MAG: rhomboid family intramembrane serine protease, partial [Vibrionaceae bacterium]